MTGDVAFGEPGWDDSGAFRLERGPVPVEVRDEDLAFVADVRRVGSGICRPALRVGPRGFHHAGRMSRAGFAQPVVRDDIRPGRRPGGGTARRTLELKSALDGPAWPQNARVRALLNDYRCRFDAARRTNESGGEDHA